MVSRQDIRDINQRVNGPDGLISALDELERLYDAADELGADPASSDGFSEAQEQAKTAIAELFDVVDDVADRTDVLESNDREEVLAQLPNPALERSENAVNRPQKPGQS